MVTRRSRTAAVETMQHEVYVRRKSGEPQLWNSCDYQTDIIWAQISFSALMADTVLHAVVTVSHPGAAEQRGSEAARPTCDSSDTNEELKD